MLGIKSPYALTCIKEGRSYKDYSDKYNRLSNTEKQKIVSLFSNE